MPGNSAGSGHQQPVSNGSAHDRTGYSGWNDSPVEQETGFISLCEYDDPDDGRFWCKNISR